MTEAQVNARCEISESFTRHNLDLTSQLEVLTDLADEVEDLMAYGDVAEDIFNPGDEE